MPIRIEAGKPSCVTSLGVAWRALEATSSKASVFQGWTWMGCLARERFSAPVVVRAEVDGMLAGLALFNRRGGRLWLSESGDAGLDAPFVEHNAPLIADGAPPGLLVAMLRVAARAGWTWGLVLNGVPEEVAAAAGGVPWRREVRCARHVDLGAVRNAGGDYLTTLSANTRQQMRRSMRGFAADGDLRLDRAATVDQALDWFDALAALHGARWRERGKPGAFASETVLRFHRALIAEGLARQEVDLLRATAGGTLLGYLYNLRRNGWICAYQSGLAVTEGAADRPGIVAHVMAIEQALADGAHRYDFLAGDARYKASLAKDERPLVWMTSVLPGWGGGPAPHDSGSNSASY